MNTLLILHIVLMTVSLIATIGSTAASVFGFVIPNKFTATNITATGIGIAAGAVLLLHAPIGANCAVLLAYTALFTAAQVLITRRNQRLADSLES